MNKTRPQRRHAGAYEHPLYYDIINTPGTAEEVTSLTRVARRFVSGWGPGRPWSARNAVWIEPACGTGRYLRVLAGRGAPCVGVDVNAGMVHFARRNLAARGLDRLARVVRADMRRMDGPGIKAALAGLARERRGLVLPRIAFCTNNSIRHLTSDKDAIAHLGSMARLIGPWGVYLVGVGLIGPEGEVAGENSTLASRGGITIREVIDFVPPEEGRRRRGRGARAERAYRFVSVLAGERALELVGQYTLRTYTLGQWRSVLGRAGLQEIAVVDEYAKLLDPDRQKYAIRVLRPSLAGR